MKCMDVAPVLSTIGLVFIVGGPKLRHEVV